MKLYFTVVAFIAMTVATFGVVLPFLFSENSYALVLAGFGVLIAFPVVAFVFLKSIYNQISVKVSK